MKLTKTELRNQEVRKQQLNKYLPTLQLKKAMLQQEVTGVANELLQIAEEFVFFEQKVEAFKSLFSDARSYDLSCALKVEEIQKVYENIAGVEVPFLKEVIFVPYSYQLFDAPVWLDTALEQLKKMVVLKIKTAICRERKSKLEKELREVSIRLNLFEKVLIPRAIENIKKIKVFLGDQQLAAVSQAKVAKKKIEVRQQAMEEIEMEIL